MTARSQAEPGLKPTTHELKCWPSVFEAIRVGMKRHEFRRDDRDFKLGDTLLLNEWDPTKGYTGQTQEVRVTWITFSPDFEVPNGYCVMSIERLRVPPADEGRRLLERARGHISNDELSDRAFACLLDDIDAYLAASGTADPEKPSAVSEHPPNATGHEETR